MSMTDLGIHTEILVSFHRLNPLYERSYVFLFVFM
jgi:hypothetical protein